ncbi:MAG: HAMP domain-containing sensor histidine kinase [Polyangiales bacterium]
MTVPEPSLAFLRGVAAGRDTPLSSLASALLEEERSASITLALPSLERVQREGAVAQIERHTRLVVHEFRNALVPMRASFNALMRAWPPGAGNGDASQHRQRVEQGMSRMFSFLGELEQAANLASALPTVFELAAVIHEAVAAVRSDHQVDAAVSVAEGLRVSGDRSRFVLALVNVLRNAAQVSERPIARVQVVATVNASGERVVVQVDDDGPGVADEDRLLVFERGFSRRPGGNGIGLALVREVIVAEMNGEARCEAGDLGGARFVLVVPLESRSAR